MYKKKTQFLYQWLKKCKTDIVISINAHSEIDFLQRQLENISNHVQSPYIIILICDDIMIDKLKNTKLSEFTYINHEVDK